MEDIPISKSLIGYNDSALAIIFLLKEKFRLELESIADSMQNECEIIFEELLLRYNNNFDKANEFVESCRKYVI